jgi:hypothetical protein
MFGLVCFFWKLFEPPPPPPPPPPAAAAAAPSARHRRRRRRRRRRPLRAPLSLSLSLSLPSAAKKKRAYRITYTLYVYMHTNFPIQLQRISKQIHDAQEPFIMHNRTRHFAEYAQLQSEPTTRSCLTQTGTSCSSDLPPVHRDALYCLRRSCQDNVSFGNS